MTQMSKSDRVTRQLAPPVSRLSSLKTVDTRPLDYLVPRWRRWPCSADFVTFGRPWCRPASRTRGWTGPAWVKNSSWLPWCRRSRWQPPPGPPATGRIERARALPIVLLRPSPWTPWTCRGWPPWRRCSVGCRWWCRSPRRTSRPRRLCPAETTWCQLKSDVSRFGFDRSSLKRHTFDVREFGVVVVEDRDVLGEVRDQFDVLDEVQVVLGFVVEVGEDNDGPHIPRVGVFRLKW